jgi:CHAT domain-containing protein
MNNLSPKVICILCLVLLSGCVGTTNSITLEEAKAISTQINVVEKPSVRDTQSFLDSLLLNVNSTRKCVEASAKGIESSSYARRTGDGGLGTGDAQFVLGNPKQAISEYYGKMDEFGAGAYAKNARLAPIYGKIASIHGYLGETSLASSALRTGYSNLTSTLTVNYATSNQGESNFVGLGALYEAEGAIAEANSDFIKAEAFYRKSIQNFDLSFSSTSGDIARTSLVRVLMKTGKHGEAESLAQRIIKRGRGGAYHILVLGLHIYTHLLYQNARYSDLIATAKISEYAYKLACGKKGNIYINDIRRLHSASLTALGKWREALKVIDQIDESMASNPQEFDRLFRGDPSRVITLIKSGDLVSAKFEAEFALKRDEDLFGATSPQYVQAKAVSAMVDLAEGHHNKALEGLRDYVTPLISQDTKISNESPALMQIVGESYLELLVEINELSKSYLLPDSNPVETAFIVADYLRSRAVQDAIARAAARAQFSDPKLDSLATKIHNTKMSIKGIRTAVSHDLTNPHSVRDQKDISKFIASESKLKVHLLELENKMLARFPKYAELMRPTTPPLREASALLRPRETLLSYYFGNSATYAWSLSGSGQSRFHRVQKTRGEVEELVAKVRHSVEIESGNLGGVRRFDIESAHELYKLLLGPFEEELLVTDDIIVIANRPLSTLPISLLPKRNIYIEPKNPFFSEYRSVPWLARDHGITYLPSVSSLKALRGVTRHEANLSPFTGFGAPDFKGDRTFSGLKESDLAFQRRGKHTWMDAPVVAKLLVLDVDGVAFDNEENKVERTFELDDQGWIDLEPNSQIKLLHTGTNTEYSVANPGRITVAGTVVKRGGTVLTGLVSRSSIDPNHDVVGPVPGVIMRGASLSGSANRDLPRLLGSNAKKFMITGLAGEVLDRGGNSPKIFDEFPENEPLQVGQDSMVEVLHLGTYTDYSVKGPGKLVLDENALLFTGADLTKQSSMLVSAIQSSETEIPTGLQMRAPTGTRNLGSAKLKDLQPLPETTVELVDMAMSLGTDPKDTVFIGREATEAFVKAADLSGINVLAFATHGLLPGDLDGLDEPALALSAPSITDSEKDDGLLTMSEILGLRLNAQWVILSACNTAAANGVASEAISGLGRAFFYAGTRALLASHWPVETNSARLLTSELFKEQATAPQMTRAKALQASMLSLIDGPGYVNPATNKTVFSYAHPVFWAPFALIGEGGHANQSN